MALLYTYVNIRNEASKAIQREKKRFAEYKLDKCSNAKQMWNGLKSLELKQRTPKTIPSHLQNPDLINDFFINSSKMNEHHLQEEIEFYEKHKLQDWCVCESEVLGVCLGPNGGSRNLFRTKWGSWVCSA
jgi:hypothetical protein